MSSVLEDLVWLRMNYASAPTAEISKRLDALVFCIGSQDLEEVGVVEKSGDHLNISIDDDLTWMEGEKIYRFRDSASKPKEHR